MRLDDQLIDIRREIAALDRERAGVHARLALLAQRGAAAIAEKECVLAALRDAASVLRACSHGRSRAEVRCLRARYVASERTWGDIAIEERYLRARLALLNKSQREAVARHRRAYQRRA